MTRIETWTSDKGREEVHHFIDGTQTYLFGVNRQLLGDECYERIRALVNQQLIHLPENN